MTPMTKPTLLSFESETRRLDVISVGEFFGEINWCGKSPLEADDVDSPDFPYETVGHFFATFPWYGAALNSAPASWDTAKDDESVSVEADTLTLEDLSALF